jgi:hypothetical protein
MAPAAPHGKPRCMLSEGVWCLHTKTHAFNQEDTLRGENLIQLLVEDVEQIFRALFAYIYMYMYMYIHTHIVCFEGKKYVLRGKKIPTAMRRVAESACACARTHACTCAEREGEREGEAGRESQWGGRKRERAGQGARRANSITFANVRTHARVRANTPRWAVVQGARRPDAR